MQMNFWTKRVIVFPDITSVESEECLIEPGIVFQRDVSAFAMQFEAKAKANQRETPPYSQSYLNDLIVRYRELDVPELAQSEEIKGT